MGKKDKKKGRGIEKTAIKTEKKLTAKQKKYLAKIGEEDIEKILADIEEEEKKKVQVKEISIEKPARRANFSFVAHPLKNELFLFGGEFFNGQKTIAYNDLINYNIDKNEWTVIQCPNAPPPRFGHQMISLAKEKGQLWVFGGEFSSSTQNQFYHYKDLWVFHIGEKRWEKILSPGSPSPRSGHRMVLSKNKIVVFGGYYDNLRDYKYFNDVYAFDLLNYKWTKLEPTGNPPAPRSACRMVSLADGKILITGGYSKEKIKKDVDKGIIHTDMFLLSPDKNDLTGEKWKWVPLKQSGIIPSPRTGSSITVGTGNRAFIFGGVFDEEESEEDITGTFFNDLYALDLEKKSWKPIVLSGKKDSGCLKKRRKKDENNESIEENENEEMQAEEEAEVKEGQQITTVTDGVFTMTVGPSNIKYENLDAGNNEINSLQTFSPSPRMNSGMVVKNSQLYLYGGLIEDNDKQFTLADFYSLDLHKLDEWKIILPDDEAKKEWIPSESEDESETEDEETETESSGEEMDTK